MGFRNPVTSLPAGAIEPGTLPAGVVLPVDQLGAGNLPPGVVVALEQLGAGTLPADVQVALGQLLDGNLPAGVRLAAAQLLDGALPAGVDVAAAQIVGQLVAGQIAAGAITVDKLTVGGLGSNLVPNGGMEDADAGGYPLRWTAATGSSYGETGTNALTGSRSLTLHTMAPGDQARADSGLFPVAGGSSVYLACLAICVGTVQAGFYARFITAADPAQVLPDNQANGSVQYDFAAAATPGGDNTHPTKYEQLYTVPAGHRWGRVVLYSVNAPTGDRWTIVDDVTVRPAVTGSLIVDGAIDGKTITGALFRTAGSGARIEMSNASAVAGWDQRSLRFFSSAAAAGATSAAVVLQYDDPASGASGLWIRSEDDPGTDKTHSQLKMGPHYAEVRASTGDGTVGGASPNMVAVMLDGSAGRVDITRPAIQALAYANGWTAFGSIYPNPGAWKDAQGVIHLEGMLKIPTGFAAGQTIATLPASMRPLVPSGGRVITWAPAGNASGMPVAVRLDLMDTGALVYQGAAAAPTAGQYLNLSGIVVTGA